MAEGEDVITGGELNILFSQSSLDLCSPSKGTISTEIISFFEAANKAGPASGIAVLFLSFIPDLLQHRRQGLCLYAYLNNIFFGLSGSILLKQFQAVFRIVIVSERKVLPSGVAAETAILSP